MAYETGSAASPAQFITALATFCQSNGWNIVLMNQDDRFFLEKGICKLALQVVAGYGLAGGLCTDFDTDKGPLQQPGYPGRNQWIDGDHMAMDVIGQYPILSYHFFAEANYVHAVVEVSVGNTFSGVYCHMGFGLIDQGNLTHGGVAFAGGSKQEYTKNPSYPLNDSTRQAFNNTEKFAWAGLGSHRAWADDAVPAHFPRTVGDVLPSYQNGYGTMLNYRYPSSAPVTNSNSSRGRLNQALVKASAPAYSGRAPMFGTPCMISHSGQLCYVGDYPGIRFLMMDGLVPGEEIDMAGEIWKVFPPRRQTPWDQVLNLNYDAPTSGQYGIAYKKVV